MTRLFPFSHRLSYWLHLMPRLQQETETDEEQMYYYKHHLLPDHENPDSYDGVVRQISFRFMTSPTAALNSSTKGHSSRLDLLPGRPRSSSSSTSSSGQQTRNTILGTQGGTSASSSNSTINAPVQTTTPAPNPSKTASNRTHANPMVMEQSSYSTALSVTIAIGCSLLILNMLIFAGVYYQLDRAKNSKDKSNNQSSAIPQPNQGQSTSGQNQVSPGMSHNSLMQQHQHHQQQQQHQMQYGQFQEVWSHSEVLLVTILFHVILLLLSGKSNNKKNQISPSRKLFSIHKMPQLYFCFMTPGNDKKYIKREKGGAGGRERANFLHER